MKRATVMRQKLMELQEKGYNIQFNELQNLWFIILEEGTQFRCPVAVYFNEDWIDENKDIVFKDKRYE